MDLAVNAASFGLEVIKAFTPGELADAIRQATAAEHSVVTDVETDPLVDAPDSESWWDGPVSATSTPESTRAARAVYEQRKARQRLFW
jgi:3D-(3,5/4)-trihydroxycyclohexane-1,2-dione acylhydrolase (decyclizing)